MQPKGPFPRKVDWSKYKFRCSELGTIFTRGQKGELIGKSATTLLREIWIRETWGYTSDFSSKYTSKGNIMEQDAINLLSDIVYDGKYLKKNSKNFQNEFITGTPDVINKADGIVHDTKCSWDVFSYLKSGITRNYELQLQGYMMLLGFNLSELDYCLLTNYEELIMDEQRKMAYVGGYIDDLNSEEYNEKADLIEFNMTFDQIPKNDRIKRFRIIKRLDFKDDLAKRAKLCRGFLSQMSLLHTPEPPKFKL